MRQTNICSNVSLDLFGLARLYIYIHTQYIPTYVQTIGNFLIYIYIYIYRVIVHIFFAQAESLEDFMFFSPSSEKSAKTMVIATWATIQSNN